MHVVIRHYKNAPKLIDLLEQRKADVERLLRDVPGFVSYYLVRSGAGGAAITVCETRIGTEESTRLAADWITDNAEDLTVAPPEIIEGDAVIQIDGS